MSPNSPLAGLQPEDRMAIDWIGGNLPPGSDITVFTPADWQHDYIGEWLPALVDARSVATVQGTEWLGPSEHRAAIHRHVDLQTCLLFGAECFAQWMTRHASIGSYLYAPKTSQRNFAAADCCSGVRETLEADPRFRTVYDGPGAQIFAFAPAP